MTVFVDTSALFALLDSDSDEHRSATRAFERLVEQEDLVSHNYVILEAIALVHRRLGVDAVTDLLRELLPIIEMDWVDRAMHAALVEAWLADAGPRVSFVDRVSFEVMRSRGIAMAFAFDRDFQRAGFSVVPAG